MKNKKWNHEFPEVPDYVHQTVLDTLAGLEEQEDKKMKKFRKRTIVILAAALMAVLGTTVAAAELFKWNEKAQDIFVAEPELEDKLVRDLLAQGGYQSVTDNGLTITAVQTIQDSNCFYALFEVTAEDEGMVISEDCGLNFTTNCQDGEDLFGAMSWGFVGNERQKPGSSRYFEIFGTKMEEKEADINMNLNFTALTGQGEKAVAGPVLIEGSWDFSLTVHPSASLRFDIEQECEIAGIPVYVESVELSPLTGKIVCRGADVKKLEEKEGVNLDQADVLSAMFVNGVKYQDGSVLRESGYLMLWEKLEEAGNYEKVVRFDRVIEPEKAAALLLGEEGDEIALQ